MKIVNIFWEKLDFDQDQIRKLNSKTDYGVYQIYGRHNAYGKDALLYIGQSCGQTFAQRLHQRWEFTESCAIPYTLRIGKIVKSNNAEDPQDWPYKDRWNEMISNCERLLLHTHAPAFNKQCNSGLYDISNEINNIHIFNWGDFGDLLPEISVYRYSFKYWSYETPLAVD
ncbi:MAG: hypothetical protein ACK4E0_15810 [Chitinophagaceae bacterium]